MSGPGKTTQLRARARAATVAVAAACALAVTTPAGAATPADPVVVHALDIAAAEIATAIYNAEDRNITCANPITKGWVVTPNRDTGTVLIRGTDAAVAEGHCVSLTNKAYSIDLSVTIERWDGLLNEYHEVCPAGEAHASSVTRTGVAATPAGTICTYDYSTRPAGTVIPLHRAHAVLTNSLNGDVRHGYSEVTWPAGDSVSAAA